MPLFEQWTFWKVDWPHQDSAAVQKRYALLISTQADFQEHGLLMFSKVTTTPSDDDLVMPIYPSHPEFNRTGLRELSYVYFANAVYLPKEGVGEYVGCLKRDLKDEACDFLRRLVSRPPGEPS